jgi:hypothetical protein
MIKAIAQALHVYIMGVFKLHGGLCDELTKMILRLWWGCRKGELDNSLDILGYYDAA